MIDMDAAAAFKGYLQPTDRIKWSARPLPEVSYALEGRKRLLYAAALAVFTGVWLLVEFSFGGPVLLKVAGVAVLAASVLVGPAYPWIRARRLARTVYALTQNQVAILQGQEMTTVPLSQVGRVEVEPRADGRGSIVFHDHRMPLSVDEYAFPMLWRRPTLFNVADAAKVRDLILEAARAGAEPDQAAAAASRVTPS